MNVVYNFLQLKYNKGDDCLVDLTHMSHDSHPQLLRQKDLSICTRELTTAASHVPHAHEPTASIATTVASATTTTSSSTSPAAAASTSIRRV